MSKKPKKGRTPEREAQHIIDCMPEGSVIDWDEKEFDMFDMQLRLISDQAQDLVWDELDRRDKEVMPDYTETKYHEMTEDEWSVYQHSVMGWDDMLTDEEDKSAAVTVTPLVNKAGTNPIKDCTCKGPGSVEDKWPSHTTQCKCYPGTQYSSGYTYKKQCEHKRQEVELAAGLPIYASSSSDIYGTVDDSIQFGVYLDSGWARHNKVPVLMDHMPGFDWLPTTEGVHPAVYLTCPDRDAPQITVADMLTLADSVFELIAQGVKVETGCIGGHGRTGTFIACMLASGGVDPLAAISQVWEDYCIQAIEDIKQVQYIVEVYETRYGTEWKEDQEYMQMWSDCMHKNFSPPVKPSTPSTVSYIGKGLNAITNWKGGVH